MNRSLRTLPAAVLLALASLLPGPARSDDEVAALMPLSLEELMDLEVSISTQTLKQISRAPAVVSVITAEDIRNTGTTNLMEILQAVPGMYIKHNLFGFKPLITFRGASGANVLLMVNGAPVKDLVWSPGIFWKGIPANMIERVEIIRGPGSALFGSDAAAGVINVITKTAGTIRRSEAGIRAGSDDSQSAWLQHGTQWNGFDIAFTADVSHTDGHRPFIARARGNTSGEGNYGWNNQDLHLSIARDRWRLLVDHTRHSDVAIGLTGGAVLDPLTRANDQLNSLALLYANPEFAKDWSLKGEFRYRDMEYSSGNGFWENIPGYAILKQENAAERRLNMELSAAYHGVASHALQFGAGYVVQDLYAYEQVLDGVSKVIDNGDTYTFLPTGSITATVVAPQKRKNHYVFVQDVWSISPQWELTAGMRYDRYSDVGGTLNPRLALVWQTTERLTTKLIHGQAFRAPSYLEQYVTTAANPPNPALTPEKSKTLELSLAYVPHRDLRLGMNLYHFKRKDVIAPSSSSPSQFQNYPEFDTDGIEFEAQWQVSRDLRLAGNFSQTRNEGIDSVLRDPSIPLKQAYLRADWAFQPKWHWNLQLNWFDERPLPAGDPRLSGRSDAFTLASTTLRYIHDKHWEFAASIRNLFDTDAREYSSRSLYYNLPLPGRNFFGELRYKF
jgi:iron complex outermembrane receptor protein